MRRLLSRAMAACLMIGAVAPARAADDVAAILKSFFNEPDATKRKALAATFAGIQPKEWAPFRALLHRAAPYDNLEPGVHRLKTPGDDVVPPVSYVLRVPPGYKADSPEGWPLLAGCQGTGGSGDGQLGMIQGLLGPDTDAWLIACPDAPEKDVYRVSRIMTDYPLGVLADVRRRANVNSNRAILTGYSKGGYTTWGTILFSPGEWAGAMPMASWPLTEARSAGCILYLENVLGLPIQAHWGADDIRAGQTQGINTLSRDAAAEMKHLGATRFEGIEYPGQGHQLTLDAAKIRTFAASARRDPFPRTFRMLFHHVWQGRAWWVRATVAAGKEFDFDAPLTLPVHRKEDIPQTERDLYRRMGMEIVASAAEDPNILVITARNLREIEVNLCPEMQDFSRPVRITVNGAPRLNGKVKIDWFELLETARRTRDFERLVGSRVRCSVPLRR